LRFSEVYEGIQMRLDGDKHQIKIRKAEETSTPLKENLDFLLSALRRRLAPGGAREAERKCSDHLQAMRRCTHMHAHKKGEGKDLVAGRGGAVNADIVLS
jgi:hypothetical protein